MNWTRRLQFSLVICALLLFPSVAISTSPAGASTSAAAALVKTAPTHILVNAQGLTLYVFASDKKNHSTCTGQCAKFWPPLLVPAGTTAPTTVSGIKGTFGVAPLAGGAKQLTFNGSPLYTFVKDKKPGDITGQGVLGTWWIAAGPAATGGAASTLVKTAPAQMLVNVQGMTLYVFTTDKKNKSTCTGQCATFWPPLELAPGASVPAAVPGVSGAFAVATRADGSKQLTFNGSPLYTFVKDKKPGDMLGQGVLGTWWIVIATAGPSTALVKTAATHILVNAQGMTLYVFSTDKKNQSTCTGQCATFWPPLLVPSGTTAPTSVSGIGGTFAVAPRADGTNQLTFNGSPLYTFVKDKKSGDFTGQGVLGTWWVAAGSAATGGAASTLVKTSSAQMLVNAQGLTLYVLSTDKKNQSTCTGQCATFWPPLLVPSGATAPAAIPGATGTFAVAPRADGSKQLTFNGSPLYTFVKDKKPGDMTGQGVAGTWWIVIASAQSSGATVVPSPTATMPPSPAATTSPSPTATFPPSPAVTPSPTPTYSGGY